VRIRAGRGSIARRYSPGSARDPTLSTSSFDHLWQSAGADDTARADTLYGWLRRTLLGEDGDPATMVVRLGQNAMSAADVPSRLTDFLATPGHHAQIVDLAGKDGAELARLARTDIGYRYALAHLDPIALTGNRALRVGQRRRQPRPRYDR
jgi:hypothetical protein